MIKLKKDGVKLDFTKNKDGIIIQVKFPKAVSTYCIVHPGNIFILTQGKWEPVSPISPSSPTRTYRDLIDKASVELREIISSQFKLSFLNYEKFFIEKVIYELFNDLDIFNWFPGYGKAVLVELLPNRMRAYYKDGSTEGFDMTKAAQSVILPFDDHKITLPSLPPLPPLSSNLNSNKTSPSIKSSPSQPIKITLPPLTPIRVKDEEVKLIISNDLSIPINVNDEGVEKSSSLPQLDEDFAEVTTEELTETDEE